MIADEMIHGSWAGLRKPARIETDTPIVPRAVAEAVWEEASVWLDAELPRAWIGELTARANAVYAHNRRFRQRIRGRGTTGRNWLWSFTRHWLSGLIHHHHPELHGRLPSGYGVGRDLLLQESAATTRQRLDQWQRPSSSRTSEPERELFAVSL